MGVSYSKLDLESIVEEAIVKADKESPRLGKSQTKWVERKAFSREVRDKKFSLLGYKDFSVACQKIQNLSKLSANDHSSILSKIDQSQSMALFQLVHRYMRNTREDVEDRDICYVANMIGQELWESEITVNDSATNAECANKGNENLRRDENNDEISGKEMDIDDVKEPMNTLEADAIERSSDVSVDENISYKSCNLAFPTVNDPTTYKCAVGNKFGIEREEKASRLQKMGMRTFCKSCSFYFESKQAHSQHDQHYHHKVKCQICDVQSEGTLNLQAHVRYSHPEEWKRLLESSNKSQDGPGASQ